MLVIALFAAALGLSQPAGAAPDPGLKWEEKVDPWVLQTAAKGPTEFLVFLTAQADLSAADALPTKLEKGTYVYQTLSELAERTQAPVLAQLQQLGVAHRSYWVANMIWVRGGMGAVQAMAQRGDVAHLYANPRVRLDELEPTMETFAPEAVDEVRWNLTLVNADDVWAAGYRGQGVVVGGQDTGYQWNHPALINQYRGWDGTSANHNYSWHDATLLYDDSAPCPEGSLVPCDSLGHGTHTMGTMVGDDGGVNQIGMAPEAKWIGCRNMYKDPVTGTHVGTPATYTECYQWFIAPTDLANQNPRPDLAPEVINNSWSCPTTEGCEDPNVLLTVVNSVRTAGILTVHAAGNYGPSCWTVKTPAAIYDASYTVGSVNQYDLVPSYSSRGPVTVDESGRMKPDIAAPGSSIYSSYPPNTYRSMDGTSMAAPHVAGLAALLISADPALAGHPDDLEFHINSTAVKLNLDWEEICGGVSSKVIPNNTFGWGRINALAAYQALDDILALNIVKTATPDQVTMGEGITYTLTVTNTHTTISATNVIVSDTLPEGTFFASASPAYTFDGSTVTWDLGTLAPVEERSLVLIVLVGINAGETITNSSYSIRSDQTGPVYGDPVSTTVVAIPLYSIFLPMTLK